MAAGERPIGQPQSVFDVVLIEDDDSVADVVEYAVGLQHYDFLRFNDGAEAARGLGEGRVKGHIVLLDIGLPSLDGFGVLQVLRDRRNLLRTLVSSCSPFAPARPRCSGHSDSARPSTWPSHSAFPFCWADSDRPLPAPRHEYC